MLLCTCILLPAASEFSSLLLEWCEHQLPLQCCGISVCCMVGAPVSFHALLPCSFLVLMDLANEPFMGDQLTSNRNTVVQKPYPPSQLVGSSHFLWGMTSGKSYLMNWVPQSLNKWCNWCKQSSVQIHLFGNVDSNLAQRLVR